MSKNPKMVEAGKKAWATRRKNKGKKKAPRISGTREWSSSTVNCVKGCEHDCRYCYARAREVTRFKRMKEEEWPKQQVNLKAVARKQKKVKGVVMFPSSHDITPSSLDACMTVLKKLLIVGNRVLIVSKPHLSCIKTMCESFMNYRDQILFRFTIGADDSALLKYWDRNAPSFEERLDCLALAKKVGYKTSVSVEPMLDSPRILDLVKKLEPHTTDTIWIGMMNNIEKRVPIKTEEDRRQVDRIIKGQTHERVREIYEALKDHPLIMWKESFKMVLGLAEEQEKWKE